MGNSNVLIMPCFLRSQRLKQIELNGMVICIIWVTAEALRKVTVDKRDKLIAQRLNRA